MIPGSAAARLRWRFRAVDSLFFRESRPIEAASGNLLESVFPPPARAVAGAMRTALGEFLDVRWSELARTDGRVHEFGNSVSQSTRNAAAAFERMRVRGPYLERADERLYPVPAFLLESRFATHALRPGRPVNTGLSGASIRMRLPWLPDSSTPPGLRRIESAWITQGMLRNVLRGESVRPSDVLRLEQIVGFEPRLGIERDSATRAAADRRLYRMSHLRLRGEVACLAESAGVAEDLVPRAGLVRFGAEGRLASFETARAPSSMPVIDPPDVVEGLTIVFVTHAQFGVDWTSSKRMVRIEKDGVTAWEMKVKVLPDLRLRVVSAVSPAAIREGGWNLSIREAESSLPGGRPRVMRELLPAGSTWFCHLMDGNEGDTIVKDPEALRAAAALLTGRQLGSEREIGRGEIVVGYW